MATMLAGIRCAGAQDAETDPNHAHPTQVVTVKREGYTIAGLVTHLAGAKGFKYGVALFPGHPGIMRLREEDGRLAFAMRAWIKTGAVPADVQGSTAR